MLVMNSEKLIARLNDRDTTIQVDGVKHDVSINTLEIRPSNNGKCHVRISGVIRSAVYKYKSLIVNTTIDIRPGEIFKGVLLEDDQRKVIESIVGIIRTTIRDYNSESEFTKMFNEIAMNEFYMSEFDMSEIAISED